MIFLAGFLDTLLRGLAFIGLALSVGGVAFRWIALRSLPPTAQRAIRRCATLIAVGAFLDGAAQLCAIVVSVWSLADDSGRWPLSAFLATGFARAAIAHAAVALALGVLAVFVRRADRGWLLAALLGLLVMATGGPLTHGASRLSHPLLLMTITVLHQLPSVVWIGGVVHLVAQWRWIRREPEGRQALWPAMVMRFSPVAMICVVALLVAGTYLALQYVHGWIGLIGTAYGTMLVTKIALLAAALVLGAMNFSASRAGRSSSRVSAAGLFSFVPVLIEAEAAIGVCILLAAAAFTGQPPAVDIQPDWAAPAEVARTFAPKVPQFTMPPYQQMLDTSRLVTDLYSLPAPLEKLQSDFNHNVSGAFVLLAAIGALLYRAAGAQWARHWPLAFAPLGLFVLVFAEPTIWPTGREPFWATLVVPEVLVHRLAAVLVLALAIFEWRVSAGGLAGTRASYVFPILCFVGGAMLLSHSHSLFVTKWAFLIEVSHNALGIFAVLAGAARWLELRLPDRQGRAVAGRVWPVCLALVGVVLLFYRET
jgi:putative copper resistance protein D